MYTLIPFRSRRELSNARNTGNLFDDSFFRSFFDMNDWMGGTGFRVDIREKDNNYLLEAELPGVDQENIELTVDNDTLTISATLNTTSDPDHSCYSERRFGHVSRSFNLEGIAADSITATSKNGILYVTLPKKQPEAKKEQRKIAIT